MNTQDKDFMSLPFTKIERFEEFYPDPITKDKVIKKPPYKYTIRITKGFVAETIRYKENDKEQMLRDWRKLKHRCTKETEIIDELKK